MPALIGLAAVVSAGAAVAGASKGAPKIPNAYSGLTRFQKDKKIEHEQRLAEIQATLQNRELDIATSQAEAANSSTRAGGWLKVAGAVFIGAILFLILRKKKLLQI